MPSARYVHPEFGYFCPTPRLRRKLGVALGCMIVGAIGVAVLRAGPDFSSALAPASGSAAMMARVEGGSFAEIARKAGQAPQAAALGLRPALNQSPKVCEENTWAYLDGKCGAGNERKPRMVRVPTNRPPIAAIPLGRTSAPAAGAAQPASATEAAEQPVAVPRKPQRTAHGQNRRRDRAEPAPARGYASVPDHRHGPFGGGFFSFR
jgi:hypothetical protein